MAAANWQAACWGMRNEGVCPRGGAPLCNRCTGTWGASPGKGKGKDMGKGWGGGKGQGWGGGQMVWQPMFQKTSYDMGKGWGGKGSFDMGKGKGKGKGKGSIVCIDMKTKGFCPRGESCKYCQLMVQKFGTNDPNDQTCWTMKMTGSCPRGDQCKYQHF
ncbi:unnamed protein product [Polarella glacialis]|uniref:C3H1-type domain-containing protein n=1 Tax=Polarella glacialis TaxID=89957 RepID=A0A813L804_POLGL|nr:unnamed protein product [Polarella glacialis]CAE8723277.1 unnamed protein product [Polarella glacialis]